MTSQPKVAKLFIGSMVLGGLASLSFGLLQIHPWHHFPFLTLLVIAIVASRLKLKLPGLNGNMSVNLPFILVAAVQLSLIEALIVGMASIVVQCFPKDGGRPQAVKTLFNVSTMAVAVGLAGPIFQGRMPLPTAWVSGSLLLVLVGVTFFLVQTVPVATIIALTEGGTIPRIWTSIVHLSFQFAVAPGGS